MTWSSSFPRSSRTTGSGRSFADGIATLSAEFPHYGAEIRAFWERWEEMVPGPIHGTVEILSDLKRRGTPLYALTNWSAETFPIARPRFPFFDWFDGIVVSGEVRLVKPDARIYQHLLDQFGLQAARPSASPVCISHRRRSCGATSRS